MNYVQGSGKSLGVGTALFLVMIALAVAGGAIPAQAQNYSILYDFTGAPSDAGAPAGLVAQGVDGNLYGYSTSGGQYGNGTIYQMSPSGGPPNVLYSFPTDDECGLGLTLGTDGNFYGACAGGGSNGSGYVFQFTLGATQPVVLYNFCKSGPPCSDGNAPSSRPIEGTPGNFYGTTLTGGANKTGTVYQITSTGAFTSLYSFPNDPNVSYPDGPLLLASDGNLYGTTQASTSDYPSCPPCGGAVYEISTDGKFFNVLHTFTGTPSDGATPTRGVIQGTDGDLYGTTVYGGFSQGLNYGTIFQLTLTPTGEVKTFTIPRPAFDDFSFTTSDYGHPRGLDQSSTGNFYGDANGCSIKKGCYDNGSLFEITPAGTFSWAHEFGGPPNDGADPDSTLSHTNGTLYGVTRGGGTDDLGVFYSLNFNAPEFCRPQITFGHQGDPIGILGQNFSSSSVVKFGGTQAEIVTQTGTFITAKIPAGAKTGLVEVTTPGFNQPALYSLQAFRVLP